MWLYETARRWKGIFMRLWATILATFCAMVPVFGADEFKQFKLDNVVQYDWGKLMAVYDQPNFQRMTFESDTAITIVQIGLVWDNKENTYRPSVRQIVTLNKSGQLHATPVQ